MQRIERQFGTARPVKRPVRWQRAAPLALGAGAALMLALHAVPSFANAPVTEEARALHDLGIAPASAGSQSGGRMIANRFAEPIAAAPERAEIEMFVRFGAGDRLGALLARLGARAGEAATVQSMLAAQSIEPGTRIQLKLGRKDAGGQRPVELVALRAGLDTDIRIAPSGAGLSALVTRLKVDETPRRVRGRVGDGLYWALRSAGIASDTASDYLKALATQIDVGSDLTPDDRFDLIISNKRVAGGDNRAGPLLYAGIDRAGAKPIRLMRWTHAGKPGWFTADGLTPVASGLVWPVAARITSGFGLRVHPILRYSRMHRGIDFGAGWGTPIHASGDGIIARAGWAGGYGQQVRIDHGEGFASSYSHMSRMVVSPGMAVSAGQLIGSVGSTGLSTGPHLHYETYIHGQAVDPRSVNFARAAAPDPAEVNAFKAQLARLLKVGSRGA